MASDPFSWLLIRSVIHWKRHLLHVASLMVGRGSGRKSLQSGRAVKDGYALGRCALVDEAEKFRATNQGNGAKSA